VEIIYQRNQAAKRNLLDEEKQELAKRRPPECFPAEQLQEWFGTVQW